MMTVDRDSRAKLASVIRQFLTGDLSAFEFDDRLFDDIEKSDDQTINFIVSALWFHYDDCVDHPVALSRSEWDYFHRLLLILESDAHIESESQRIWRPPQLIAAIGLLGFIYCAMLVGIGIHLLILSIPFGALSIALSFWRQRYTPTLTADEESLFPFSSFTELLTARRSIAHFVKQRYPSEIANRQIRTKTMEAILWFQWYMIWLLLSPIALLFQTLPLRQSTTRVTA